MYARIVRFTDVSQERIDSLRERIGEDGPPEGLSFERMNLLHDADQATAVSIQIYASQADLEAAEEIMGGMDSDATPGTRVSVDRGEVVAGTGVS